jgi:hypothetical protein
MQPQIDFGKLYVHEMAFTSRPPLLTSWFFGQQKTFPLLKYSKFPLWLKSAPMLCGTKLSFFCNATVVQLVSVYQLRLHHYLRSRPLWEASSATGVCASILWNDLLMFDYFTICILSIFLFHSSGTKIWSWKNIFLKYKNYILCFLEYVQLLLNLTVW